MGREGHLVRQRRHVHHVDAAGGRRWEGGRSHEACRCISSVPASYGQLVAFGVPSLPRPSSASIIVAVVNSARRGVGNIGLLEASATSVSHGEPGSTSQAWPRGRKGGKGTHLASLSLKFCDRSAAREAPGEEPRTALLPKNSAPGSWKVNWFLPSGLGTRRGPKRLDWPKLEGGAGRMAASGDEVSMPMQDNGACTSAGRECLLLLVFYRRDRRRRRVGAGVRSTDDGGEVEVEVGGVDRGRERGREAG